MKKIIYTLIGGLILLMVSCTRSAIDVPDPQVSVDADEVLVEFGAIIPDYRMVELRDNGGINNMSLLVFNQNGILIARREAALLGASGSGYRFSVILPKSDDIRTIHFIADCDWSTIPDADIVGSNEAMVVALMTTDRVAFWARKELPNGIDVNSLPDNIPLLRNQAKITVIDEADNFELEGFTLHNTLARGTVAPYDTGTFTFTEGAINEPIAPVLVLAQESTLDMNEKYLFERKNKTASRITTVIVKGKYSGQPSTYYKIDLIDVNKVRYDIERNYHYVVKIRSVHKAGSPTFAAALDVASHNNTALDPTVEKFPIISDGVSKLEVERTLIILTKPLEALTTWAKYYPQLNNDNVDNTGVLCRVEQETGKEVINASSLNFATGTGVITATAVNVLPSQPREARIIVSKGDFLARAIRVVLRQPFSFGQVKINNNNTVPQGLQREARLYFNIPADFPADLFPLYVKIKAGTLYPVDEGVEVITGGGTMYHIVRVTSHGTKEVRFKTNSKSSTETVEVTADYFQSGEVTYTRS
ncbi:hypothetical protein HQ35_07030 [Porphyromonas cangingivalis]|uniref:Fimbrillin-A associated anchor protein Mfa1 and Mfa2 n=1 Tax=Porphyromonas cangingivalis TaxID=36874 RepID=A0A0A2EQJ7_PORCN|nr:hypothetical protein [Porphyromonas cangingivalis]KGN79750.1 hypothetical protein HQ35_07030 [Porphyromonas cangingivalis]